MKSSLTHPNYEAKAFTYGNKGVRIINVRVTI